MTWRADPDIPGEIQFLGNTSFTLGDAMNSTTISVKGLKFGRCIIDFSVYYT